MTGRATILWSGVAAQMLCVIESDVEAFFKAIGKALAGRIAAIHALVTDRTHGNTRRSELRQMTTRAGLVSGKIGPHRIVSATMTFVAGNRRVL